MSTPAQPLFDMSKATPIQGQQPLFDMSKAQPINGQAPTPMPSDPARGAGQATGLKAAPKPFTSEWFKQQGLNAADAVTEGLPAIGATVGGLIGGGAGSAVPGPGTVVGGVGGAGIGGMGGEAAKQIFRRMIGFGDAPATSQEAAGNIAKQGVVQGGVQAASEALPFLANPLRNAAAAQYERALAPTTKINKNITQKIVPEMIDRGVKGNLGSIEARAADEAANVGPQLDAAYARAPGTSGVNAGPKIYQDLENLKGQYTVNGIPANDTAIKAISGVQDIVQRFGNDISPDSLRALKRIFDDPVAKAGGYAGTDLSTKYTLEAQQEAATSIRKIMAQASPDVAALNKEMTFWLNVQKVTKESSLRQTGQAGGLMKVLAPLGTGLAGSAGFLAGGAHGSIEAGSIAAATALVVQIVRSPAYRTMSAVAKNQLADALARGQVGQVAAVAARLGIAAPGMKTQDNQQFPSATQQPAQ